MQQPEFDKDGYPTSNTLEAIRDFIGTPHEFVDFISECWYLHGPVVEFGSDDFDRQVVWVTMVTHGWSGNESVIGAMENNMFWFAYWWMEQRGGMYKFRINGKNWDESHLSRNPYADPLEDQLVRERVRVRELEERVLTLSKMVIVASE